MVVRLSAALISISAAISTDTTAADTSADLYATAIEPTTITSPTAITSPTVAKLYAKTLLQSKLWYSTYDT